MTCFGKRAMEYEENEIPSRSNLSSPENPEAMIASGSTLNGITPPFTGNASGPREGGLVAWLSGRSLLFAMTHRNANMFTSSVVALFLAVMNTW